MSNWNCELFDEFDKKASKYSYIELAFWIIKCRNFINKSTYNKMEDYQNDVYTFCKEWEKHYEKNEKLYCGEKFKKAILFIGRKDKFKFLVDFGNDKEDISDSIFSNMTNSAFYKETSEIVLKMYNDEILEKNEAFKNCFSNNENFKTKLNELISEFYFNKTTSRIRVFKDNKWFQCPSYKEFLKECEKIDNYELIVEPKKSYSSYLNALEDYDIPKTTYTDYMSPIKAEKAYDKKFFINLAFVLSLPYAFAKNLLYYNGFSFKDSVKQFDIICEKAFRIGYGRDYVIALIDKYNADMKKNFPNFVEVQNITKTSKIRRKKTTI